MSAEADQLALQMFRTFARFEYALKAAGFHSGEGTAEANWTTFAKAFPEVLKKPGSEELKEAIDYFDKNPPKKQVIVDGALDWSPSPPNTNNKSDEILIYICPARQE